jgi:PPOX class probable F420-dependent enzyme
MTAPKRAQLSGPPRNFLETMKVPCVLATIGRSSGPVTSAVWYAVRDDTIIVSTPAGKTKANNVLANPRVSLLVDSRERPYSGVAVEGHAVVTPDPAGEGWRFIVHRYLGDDAPGEILERARTQERALIVITPLRIRHWNLG